MMEISVVLPVYNGMPHLKDAVESVLAQEEEFELIVSDDKSTDLSLEYLKGIHDPRIRIVENERNYGIFGNLNRCLKEAKGDYIQVFSQDDLMKPQYIVLQKRMLEKYPDAGLVYGMPDYIDGKGRIISPGKKGDTTPEYINQRTYLWIASHWSALPASISSVMIRRSVFDQIGLFNESYRVAGDIEFYNRVSEHFPILRNKEILHTVRSHAGATSNPSSAGSQYLLEETLLENWYRSRWSADDFRSIRKFRAMTRGVYHFGWARRKAWQGELGSALQDLRCITHIYPVHWILWGIARRKLFNSYIHPEIPASHFYSEDSA